MSMPKKAGFSYVFANTRRKVSVKFSFKLLEIPEYFNLSSFNPVGTVKVKRKV